MSGPCQEPAGIAGAAEEVVEGLDTVVDGGPDELEWMASRPVGNSCWYYALDPGHKELPTMDPDASKYPPDCPVRDTFGSEADDVEGVTKGPGRDGGMDRLGQTMGLSWRWLELVGDDVYNWKVRARVVHD